MKSAKFQRIAMLKKEKIKEKVRNKDFSFEGARLLNIDFSGMKIEGSLVFDEAKILHVFCKETEISQDVSFDTAEIAGNFCFENAKIDGNVRACYCKIGEDADFKNAKIGGSVDFAIAEIGRDVDFRDAEIGDSFVFNSVKIGGAPILEGAKIRGTINFIQAKIHQGFWFTDIEVGGNVVFSMAEIEHVTFFAPFKIGGFLTFRKAKFGSPYAQEEACREAKNILEDLGDRELADYHFYREMEAKRKVKHPILRVLELPIQYLFGYGVYPSRIVLTWLSVVFSFALFFWFANGIEGAHSPLDCIYFSIVNAAKSGQEGLYPKPGIFQALASLEAIFGTFNWAALIATFARKYMKA
jgi:hypothetical protein